MQQLVIATRKSRLAMWQSQHVADALARVRPGLAVELMPLSTRGDEILDRSLAEIGGKGLFLKELEKALLDGRADIAVHSLKDVPATQPEGLELGAYLPRANPLDLWIGRGGQPLDRLPPGSRVGSSSLRRISQLRARRSDIETVPLRGNVETRLSAVREGRVDATILAAAGLERLGLVPEHALAMASPAWLPAPGQGIIVVQQRAGDPDVAGLVAQLACARTTVQARAERAVVAALGGDCTMPLAAHAFVDDERVVLRSRLGDEDGQLIDAEARGTPSEPEALGREAADRLLNDGGRELLERLNAS